MAPLNNNNSPPLDVSSEDIPPLAFDTEEELLDVLARLRQDLLRRVETQTRREASVNNGKGKGKANNSNSVIDREELEDIVIKVCSSLDDSGLIDPAG